MRAEARTPIWKMPVKLETIVPWGRSLGEYAQCFSLSEVEMHRSILDCGGGPSSFNAEMTVGGRRVISVDPIYQFSADEIRQHVQAVRDPLIDEVRRQSTQFVWDYIRSPEHLEELRMAAMDRFLEDYAANTNCDRYQPQSLPKLDFSDQKFELALCSHLLFLYSDLLDEAFHIAAIGELLRMADEVRIFPVTDLSGAHSPHLQAVRKQFNAELVQVDYEFLRGANQMLVIARS